MCIDESRLDGAVLARALHVENVYIFGCADGISLIPGWGLLGRAVEPDGYGFGVAQEVAVGG